MKFKNIFNNKWRSIIGIVSVCLYLLPLLFLIFVTNFDSRIVSLFAVLFLFALHNLIKIFEDKVSEIEEAKLKYDDVDLLKLEVQDSAMNYQLTYGLAFAFLIPGFINFEQHYWFLISGLSFLILGTMIHHFSYLPKFYYLRRKRLIHIDINKNKKN